MAAKKKDSEPPSDRSAAARAASASARAARSAGALTEEQGNSGPAAKKTPKPRPAGALTAEQPGKTDSGDGEAPQAELKKKELIERVVERSGVKKKDAKPVVEAMLTVLGEALGEGRELSLQPLGKLRVTRAKDLPNGKLMVTRIRQSGPALEELEQAAATEGEFSAKEPLAEDGEDR
ncbi:MAG: HU family DNA-binding protein [Rhodobacteraceae bacterium]|nr:HU family DNA-binding protein [Paracoccaceae bacterium]MBR9819383.1 HU family DNA-binding protein [Paracoccaceae bacterium]